MSIIPPFLQGDINRAIAEDNKQIEDLENIEQYDFEDLTKHKDRLDKKFDFGNFEVKDFKCYRSVRLLLEENLETKKLKDKFRNNLLLRKENKTIQYNTIQSYVRLKKILIVGRIKLGRGYMIKALYIQVRL